MLISAVSFTTRELFDFSLFHHKLGNVLQAWEFFLLRPGWWISATKWTSAHKQHTQAVSRLNDATEMVIAKVNLV